MEQWWESELNLLSPCYDVNCALSLFLSLSPGGEQPAGGSHPVVFGWMQADHALGVTREMLEDDGVHKIGKDGEAE